MDTLIECDGPAEVASKATNLRRLVILAGLTLPLALALKGGIAAEKPAADRSHAAPAATQHAATRSAATQPVAPQSAPPRSGQDPLTDALAGEHSGLSRRDRDAYGLAFAALDRGDWIAVDNALAGITDRRLAGHVLAARFLAPGAKPAYGELRGWLDLYAELPEADDIYRLAQAAQPPDAPATPKPRAPSAQGEVAAAPDQPGSADLKTAAVDRAVTRFSMANDKAALAEALRAIATLGGHASAAQWIAGLAAWRLGSFDEAGRHFAALAGAGDASGWMQAAGAYWAGRVDERRGVATAAAKWFGRASRYPTTFYGMLATRKLGLDIAQRVSAASLTADHLDRLAETPAGYRAVALLEIGRDDLAARELERIDPAGNPRLEEAIVVVADAAGLGKLSSILAQRIARPADDAKSQFPIPVWKPRGGFRVDPALVYAVARQESGFDPRALSPAGATGLMQIMPETAHQMVPNGEQSLFDPETNLDVGQRYLSTLMRDPNIGENLLLVAVAYNQGKGNRAEFRKMLRRGDPLLAVESIPAAETRNFIQRVLANYWVYKARLGGPNTSLNDLANGRWPIYRWTTDPGDLVLSYRLLDQ